MAYEEQRLRRIFEKTGGFCEYCGTDLLWNNYNDHEAPGGWHVDHSKPRSRGGSDHLNNLFPACVECNLDKGDQHGRTYRDQPSRGAPTPGAGGIGILGFGLALLGGYAILKALDDEGQDGSGRPGRRRGRF